jgi:hypothetical protein
VLDPTFDPSSEEAQEFLQNFCQDILEQDFAALPTVNYTCPLDSFDLWLANQTRSDHPDAIYLQNCGGATGLPVPQEQFDACIVAYSEKVGETRILSLNGKVQIIFFPFVSRVRWDSPYDALDDEWHAIENWIDAQSQTAPLGVDKGFFCSFDFWWYDTNGQMLSTAYGAAAIALSAAALVLFVSSRSLVLTLFATITIGYVLTSVTATLVGLGWTLGFLESICFAILIGVSVDFVIHFCHAYAKKAGAMDRGERTQFALIRMGPSILAAAFTSIAIAVIMLFTIM